MPRTPDETAPQTGWHRSVAAAIFDGFLAVWQATDRLPPPKLLLVLLAGLGSICGVIAFIGAVPTRIYGHDIFFLLDNGWRVLNGVHPHLDYYSPWGPLMFLVSALGLKISGHSVDGVGYGNAITALVVGVWSFFLARGRLAATPRLLVSFFLAALVGSPHALGISPFVSSHAMVYNRYGYALAALILVDCLAPLPGKGREWAGAISTGAALALTLFLKASFFVVGMGLLVSLSFFLMRFSWRRTAGIVGGFFLISICMLTYLRFDLPAILGDLRMAGAARAEVLTPDILVWAALNHADQLVIVVLFALASALLIGNQDPEWRGLRVPLVGAIVFFADVGLISTNQQMDGFPLCAVFALLAMSAATREQQAAISGEGRSYRHSYAIVLCFGAVLFIPFFAGDLAALSYGAWKKARPSTPAAVLRFTSAPLKPLLLYDGAAPVSSNGRVYTTYVNDGVALLERETRPEETILTMDMANPFPYALQRRPPRAGVAAMTYHITMSDGHRPTDDRYFGDADIVMVPKHPAEVAIFYDDFRRAYEPGLRQRYALAAETDWWWMYRRK